MAKTLRATNEDGIFENQTESLLFTKSKSKAISKARKYMRSHPNG